MKRCTKCGVLKPRDAFYRAAGCKDGLRGDCKECFAARSKRWYAENREHVIARVRAWQRANPERVNASQRARRVAHPERGRAGHLRRTFKISLEDYEQMLCRQDHRCAICGRSPKAGVALHVDHDHESGAIRGLLCFSCNESLGRFGDDVERLSLAGDYLTGVIESSSERAKLRELALVRARELIAAPG